MIYYLFLYPIAALLALFSPAGKVFPYDLSKPSHEIVLPRVLHEVSGITETGPETFVAVQDENGILFFYDLLKQDISRQLAFGYDGDYEGVTRVGKTLFVLRSDGALYEIPDMDQNSANTIHYQNNISASNNEGLCYDKKRNRLLIGSKGMVDDEWKTDRFIYAFDLKTRRMAKKPAYRFNVTDITEFAAARKLHEPYKITSKGNVRPNLLKVRTSEIAIHPKSGHLYMLAAMDFLLIVFDRGGKVIHMEKLNEQRFKQAEGLTFLSNGDMLISNEGADGEPTLLRFKAGNF